MTKYTKQRLIEFFVSTIEAEGAVVEYRSSKEQHPFSLYVYGDEIDSTFRVYIWNLSRGGKGRPSDEYRIQVTGLSSFIQHENENTLILGYWDQLELFIAFDYKKHDTVLGTSVSLQIREDALHNAVINGISIYRKENEERVVIFSKENALVYLKNHELIHNGTYNIENIDRRHYLDLTEDEPSPYRFSVASYGVDYPIDSIVQRIDNDAIYVPPFQRQFVWSREEASRFIESIILGLPVPGVFLAHESMNRLIIVDGQQRLMSLYFFFKGVLRGEKFALKGVLPDIEGRTYATLLYEDRLRLENQTIHATILKPNDSAEEFSSIYSLFERLNTGGVKLTAQEIRSSIYFGKFNDYLAELIRLSDWNNIFSYSNDKTKNQELILRFFALYLNKATYEKPMTSFLNYFMSTNRNFEKYSKEYLDSIIKPALSLISGSLGKRAFRLGGGINAAVFDSVMVAVASSLEAASRLDKELFVSTYYNLLKDEQYVKSVRSGTSEKTAIETRLATAQLYINQALPKNLE